jgi:ferredoxin
MGLDVSHARPPSLLDGARLDDLIHLLHEGGRRVYGPVRRDGAIVLDSVASLEDLPRGLVDEQDAGRYRLLPEADGAFFSTVVGPQSWKKFLLLPRETLWTAAGEGPSFRLELPPSEEPPQAFFGVRGCELAALAIHDRVLRDGPYADARYSRRRDRLTIVAVDCTRAGGTCFCAALGTGPRVTGGCDIALTEVRSPDAHRFLARSYSEHGDRLLDRLDAPPASAADAESAASACQAAAAMQRRTLDPSDLPELLAANLENPLWSQVAQRCLGCANCTLVCPTCFCTEVEDGIGLDGRARHERRWDSCFNLRFSYMHGGAVRQSLASRYRQWLTHKLGTWHEQFGTSGCVGCGRCITWCPAGIDLTVEVGTLRATDVRLAAPRTGG